MDRDGLMIERLVMDGAKRRKEARYGSGMSMYITFVLLLSVIGKEARGNCDAYDCYIYMSAGVFLMVGIIGRVLSGRRRYVRYLEGLKERYYGK